jgi:GGDEF domain-containing protein
VDQVLLSISKRLQNVVAPESALSRWRSDVVCVTSAGALAKRVAGEILKAVGGKYVCMEDGVAHTLRVQVVVTYASATNRDDVDAFIQKLDSLSAAQ